MITALKTELWSTLTGHSVVFWLTDAVWFMLKIKEIQNSTLKLADSLDWDKIHAELPVQGSSGFKEPKCKYTLGSDHTNSLGLSLPATYPR